MDRGGTVTTFGDWKQPNQSKPASELLVPWNGELAWSGHLARRAFVGLETVALLNRLRSRSAS